MLVSPFTFYRGAAAVMAADLAAAPSTGLMCQLCGDAHLSNFGGFASPDRRHLFDQFRFVDMARKARTPAPATGSRSPPTSARMTPSTVPWSGERYADRTERDHAAMAEAVRTGRIEAATGV